VTAKNLITLTVLFLALTLTGCGSFNLLNPPAAHAFSLPPNCNSTGVCSGSAPHQWGDSSGQSCYYETHQFTHSATIHVEIPISKTPESFPGDNYCFVPIAFGNVNITSVDGSISYDNWNTTGIASMSTNLLVNGFSCNCGEDGIVSHKLQVPKAPISGNIAMTSQPFSVKLPTPLLIQNYFVISISDDLAKPTTLHYAFTAHF